MSILDAIEAALRSEALRSRAEWMRDIERVREIMDRAEAALGGLLRRIDELEAREAESARRAVGTLQELAECVENPHQRAILERLDGRDEENQLYLVEYTAVQDRKKPHVEGVFSVLGAMRKGVRESYSVTLYKPTSEKPSLYCTCSYNKFTSGKHGGTTCKHASFLVCKVARLLDPSFFATRKLSADQHAALLARMQEPRAVSAVMVPEDAITAASFMGSGRRGAVCAEEECPICYSNFGDDSVVCCPTCANYTHRECMEVWLERGSQCVYCRSSVWQHYRTVLRGGMVRFPG